MWYMLELFYKVEKVKKTKKFQDFCVKNFDEWNMKVNTLYKYFKN